jgi:Flp pilus assembly pilin Flp
MGEREAPMLEYLLLYNRLKANRRAVTSLEYGLLGGIIVWAIAIGFTEMAGSLSTKFSGIGHSL